MYSFKNDYSEGMHPSIMQVLMDTNNTQEEGYGLDRISSQAKERIREVIGRPDADIHFISGGTQTNLISISAFLRPHEACICVDTGHIETHETGSIEYTGHKVVTVPHHEGKLLPEQVRQVVKGHPDEHMVKPKLVYISNPTELGTVYSREELEALASCCQELGLYFYLDGARLATAVTLDTQSVTMEDVGRYSDAFYIGGTKNGCLFGEALVINRGELQQDFRYHLKQKGALLAKGRSIGAQFLGMFTDDLFYTMARHANKQAQRLACEMKNLGIKFFIESPTNQIFPILPNRVIDELSKSYGFHDWEVISKDLTAIRLVTSWATPEEEVDTFIVTLQQAIKELEHA